MKEEAQDLGTVQKRIAKYNDWRIGQFEKLTYWQTDGRRVKYLSEYFYEKKGSKNPGEFFKNLPNRYEQNAVAQWRRVGLNFRYHFINRDEILNKMAMLKYFSTYNWIVYFHISIMGPSQPVRKSAFSYAI